VKMLLIAAAAALTIIVPQAQADDYAVEGSAAFCRGWYRDATQGDASSAVRCKAVGDHVLLIIEPGAPPIFNPQFICGAVIISALQNMPESARMVRIFAVDLRNPDGEHIIRCTSP
jgi:hypothetical protein